MKSFRLSKKHKLLTLGVIFVALVSGSAYFGMVTGGGALSAEQLDKKFDCSRVTADVRATDIFCSNPKFYNSPETVTYQEYYDLQGCEERLRNQPPPESLKQTDPGFYAAYYQCNDPNKMKELHQDFIKRLKDLKIKNS